MADLVVTLSGSEAKLYAAMQRIVEQQAKLDKGFDANKKASKQAADEAKKNADAMGGGIEGAAAKATAMVGAYSGISAGINAVVQVFDKMIEKQQASFDLAVQTAKFQQESAKNLTGLTSPEISQALTVDTPRIAREQGFADLGKITEAIGAGYSASGDLKATISAVEAAAALTRLTAEQLPVVASGALDVARGSGSSDARENLAFLLSAGKSARIEDPARLSRTVAPTVSSGVATVPGQDRKQAAIEIASLFTTFNQAATDVTGDSTRTATTTFLATLDAFFKSQENDPGTVFGRIQALQQDPELRAQFFDKPFGEVAFRKAFEQVADDSTDLAKAMKAAAAEINFGTETYMQKVKELESATPQIVIASSVAKVEAAAQATRFEDTAGASREAIAKITDETLSATNTGGIVNFVGKAFETMFASMGMSAERSRMAQTDAELLQASLQSLLIRRQELESKPITPEIEKALATISRAIDELAKVAPQLRGVSTEAVEMTKSLGSAADAAKNANKQRAAANVGRE